MKEKLTVKEINELRIEAEQEVKDIMRDFLNKISGNNLNINLEIMLSGYEPEPSQVEFSINLEIAKN